MAVDIGPKIGIDGEKEFRQSIQNINQQIKTLSSEMKAATSSFRDEADAQKRSEAQAKSLTEQIDAQKKKIDLLRQGMERSAEKFGENDARTLKWRQALADATTTLNNMERELEDVSQDVDDVGDEMEDSSKDATTFGDVMKGTLASGAILSGVKALWSGIKNLSSAIKSTVLDTAELADNIDKQSQKIGISREEYQKLSYALDKYGVNVDILQGGLKTLSTQAQKGSEAFTKLGISQEDVKNSSPEKLFDLTVTALQKMEEGTERTTIATQLLGRSATELNPLLNDTKENFVALKNEAPLLSDATIDAGAAMTDSMSAFKSTMSDLKAGIVTSIMPSITKAFDAVRRTLTKGDAKKSIEKAGKALGTIVSAIAKAVAGVLPALAKVLTFIVDNFGTLAVAIGGVVLAWKGMSIVSSVISLINSAKTAFAGLSATMAANPIGAVVAALGLLVAVVGAVASATSGMTDEEKKLAEQMQEVKDRAADAKEAFDSSVDTLANNAILINNNAERSRELWQELERLAGATGVVRERDKERAQYILGELNEALGTEYKMTGNQIAQYDSMRDSIYEVIRAKKANALLDASKGAYEDAVVNRDAEQKNLILREQELVEAQNKLEEAIKNGNDVQIGIGQLLVDKAQAAYDASAEALGTYEYTVDAYGKAAAAIATGDYDYGVKLISSITGSRFDAYNENARLSENEKIQLQNDIAEREKILDEYRKNEAEGRKGFTKETIAAEQEKLDRLKRLYDNQKTAWVSRGADLSKGFANGIGSGKSAAQQKSSELVGQFVTAVNGATPDAQRAGKSAAENFASGIGSGKSASQQKSSELVGQFVTAVNGATPDAQRAGKSAAENFASGIGFGSPAAAEKASGLLSNVIANLEGAATAEEKGKMISEGLIRGMLNVKARLEGAATTIIETVMGTIHSVGAFGSPSKRTTQYGKWLDEGLERGIGAGSASVIRKAGQVAADVVDAMDVGLAGSPSLGAGTVSNSYSTNLGGITLIVNGSGVENVDRLADLVSARLYDQVINAQNARR